MDSFSVWIKVSSKKLSPNSSQFGVEYHLNLWHLRKGDPFIDIGLMIPLNEGLEQLAIDLPLSITKDDIQDLHDKLMEKKVGPLVFNTNCTAASKDSFDSRRISTLSFSDKPDTVLLVPVCDDSKAGVEFDLNDSHHQIRVNMLTIKQFTDGLSCNKVYLRFRITGSSIKKALFCKLRRKNQFLESAFIRTQIIDIKINEIRNINLETSERMKNEGWELSSLSKVHLFVMEPAENEIIYGDSEADCRRLESEWNTYLGKDAKGDNRHILAYHWSKKMVGGAAFSNYTKLITISSSETNAKLISVYIIVAIILSCLSDGIYEWITSLNWSQWISAFVSGLENFFKF